MKPWDIFKIAAVVVAAIALIVVLVSCAILLVNYSFIDLTKAKTELLREQRLFKVI